MIRIKIMKIESVNYNFEEYIIFVGKQGWQKRDEYILINACSKYQT